MNIYKQASREKLRFETNKGFLSVEQLWSLPNSSLVQLIKHLKKSISPEEEKGLDFLEATYVKNNNIDNLRFEIAKDIYLTRKEEREQEQVKEQNKIHNQRIYELIQEKQESELKSKSLEELQAMIKE